MLAGRICGKGGGYTMSNGDYFFRVFKENLITYTYIMEDKKYVY